jgi:hypothetical protein
MKALAQQALGAAMRSGVTYADVRAEDIRERHVSTKNGKVGNASTTDSFGASGFWRMAVGGLPLLTNYRPRVSREQLFSQ